MEVTEAESVRANTEAINYRIDIYSTNRENDKQIKVNLHV